MNACGLLLLLWTNLENISRILIFADLELPRNSTKIRRRENFPFYGMLILGVIIEGFLLFDCLVYRLDIASIASPKCCTCCMLSQGPDVIKLNSNEHEIYPAHKC